MDEREKIFTKLTVTQQQLLHNEARALPTQQLRELEKELKKRLRKIDQRLDGVEETPQQHPPQPAPTSLQLFDLALRKAMFYRNKKRSFFEKIFGRHPIAMMAHAIHEAIITGKRVDHKSPYKPFIVHFVEQAERVWNHKFYSEEFPQLYKLWEIEREKDDSIQDY